MMAMIATMSSRVAMPKPLLAVSLCALVLFLCKVSGTVDNEGERGEQGGVESSKLAVIEYRSSNLFPEGFDWDAKHKRFLVGSMGHGKLVAVTLDGEVEDFVTYDEANRDLVTLGVTIDAMRNRVLATVHGAKGPGFNALVAYDLDSKKRTLFVNLWDEARALLEDAEAKGGRASSRDIANDVAVDLEGNAYVTNSGGNSVWKVTAGGLKTVLVASIPQLPVIAELQLAKESGTNGIVYTNGYLLVGQSNSGALFRVRVDDDRPHEELVWEVKLRDGKAMSGADCIALRPDGSLVVVSVDTAWLVTSRDSWRTATIVDQVALNAAEFTTGAAVVDQRVFTLQLHYFDLLRGIDRELFTIREVAFPYDVDNNPLWLLMIAAIFIVLILAWRFQLQQFNKAYTKKRL